MTAWEQSQIFDVTGFAVFVIGDDDAKPLMEIFFVFGQAHNRHHLARDGDDETILAFDAILWRLGPR
jgi:hypothetical protein